MSVTIDRRRIIGWGAGLALAPAAARAQSNPFTLGVASGEPLPDGFVIWTRLAPDPLAPDGRGGMERSASVEWQVAEDEAMKRVVRRGRVRVDDKLGWSVHVEVAGLSPNRDYFYRFTAMGAQSPVGRGRTAPAPGAPLTSYKIAAASCAHFEAGWFSAYRHMAAERPDLVLFLGDYIYEYSYAGERAARAVRRHSVQGELRDLTAFRNRYAQHRTDPDLQALHAIAPCLATWDDHEVQNDYAGPYPALGALPQPEFEGRRRVAYQAFYEHMPLRRRALPTPTDMRLFERFRFGDLVEITMLDERQYRSIQPCPVGNSRRGHVAPLTCPDLEAADRTMLGLAQEEWLYKGFAAAKTRWNLIGQQLYVSPYLQETSDGQPGAHTEGWGGYGANRTRMLSAMTGAKLSNPVILGGDMHAFMTSDLKFGDQVVGTEFIGTSITSDGPGPQFASNLSKNPHVKFFDARYRGYMALELRPERLEMRYQAIGDRADLASGVSTLQRYVVEDGRAGAIED